MQQIIDNLSILTQIPVINLGLLIDGLLIGAVFALAAYGLALVWGVMNVKNLAQGDFVIVGGYIAWWIGHQGIHPLFGVPIAFVVMWGFGWLVYQLVVRHVIERDLFTSLLATFGQLTSTTRVPASTRRRANRQLKPGAKPAPTRTVQSWALASASRSSRAAPMQYLRIGPTPCVMTSQPASVSIGDPQLPTFTDSHISRGRRITWGSLQ